jgi:GTP cyclohydrolase II
MMSTGVCCTTARQVAAADLPTVRGIFRVLGFERTVGNRTETAVALVKGSLATCVPLVRIHSQCMTSEVFGSVRCDCEQQLSMAMDAIAAEGHGVLIYEMQEGRGIGLMAKLRAYALQDHGLDTVQANEHLGYAVDYRDYALPVAILQSFGLHQVRLITNNPRKVEAVERGGIAMVERVPCEVVPDPHARAYLVTKKGKLGHLLTQV